MEFHARARLPLWTGGQRFRMRNAPVA
jgi:hypothetical protein